MDEIAERVGLSKGTIYLYFKSKENLFFSIIVQRMEKLYKRLKQSLDCDGPFEECFRGFISNFMYFFQEHEAFFKIIHSEKTRLNLEDHYKMHELGEEASRGFFILLRQLIQKGQKEGFLRGGNPEAMGKALMGILEGFSWSRIVLGHGSDIETEIDQIIDLYFNGVKQ